MKPKHHFWLWFFYIYVTLWLPFFWTRPIISLSSVVTPDNKGYDQKYMVSHWLFVEKKIGPKIRQSKVMIFNSFINQCSHYKQPDRISVSVPIAKRYIGQILWLHSWKRYYALCILILLAHNVYSMEHAWRIHQSICITQTLGHMRIHYTSFITSTLHILHGGCVTRTSCIHSIYTS